MIPRQHLPLAAAASVAIHVVVLEAAVLVLHELNGGHPIDDLRHIDMIEEIIPPSRPGLTQAIDQRLEIVVWLSLARGLLGAGVGIGKREIDLVERTLW